MTKRTTKLHTPVTVRVTGPELVDIDSLRLSLGLNRSELIRLALQHLSHAHRLTKLDQPAPEGA
jgi:hypothetical protein